jgi:hypothetical protein
MTLVSDGLLSPGTSFIPLARAISRREPTLGTSSSSAPFPRLATVPFDDRSLATNLSLSIFSRSLDFALLLLELEDDGPLAREASTLRRLFAARDEGSSLTFDL